MTPAPHVLITDGETRFALAACRGLRGHEPTPPQPRQTIETDRPLAAEAEVVGDRRGAGAHAEVGELLAERDDVVLDRRSHSGG